MVNFGEDPVAFGLAASVAHPGGNITGFMIWSDPAIVGKQLGLLKELAPSIVASMLCFRRATQKRSACFLMSPGT
jgi:putative ABC transport system substrate-binding protein